MSYLLQVKGKGKCILRPAQSGSEVTMYITNKSKENTFCVQLNLAPRLQHTLQVKAKENTFCVRLNPAPLQYAKQIWLRIHYR